jgi:competence protein ComEC
VSPEHRAVGVAVAAVLGALVPSSGSLTLAAVVAAVALLVRWPALRWLAVALLASGLGHRALEGLDGVRPGVVHADVQLLGDPVPAPGSVRVDVRWGGRRLEARARGASAEALRPRLAGEVVRVRGTVRPLEHQRPWLVARHIGGELTVLRVDGWHPGDPASRFTNAIRRTLARGATPLGPRARSLYTGLVVGDDREQPDDLADSFRGAGLTHLLAVSGQNVAFALALAGPLLRRLRLWPRLAATLAVIALFGLMTRFEPSVLRASAMAGLAAVLAMPGPPVGRLRIIGLAVTGLVLVDPLLVRSVGFQLSTSAAVAIVVLAPRLAAALPGPAPLREAAAVTVAAQLGVAPVLLATFGPIPVASAPANLLAVPVAGAVMVWGFTGGLAAGIAGGKVAEALHQPTELALTWLELVAVRAARAPLGELQEAQVLALAVGLALLVVARRTSWRTGGAVVAATAVISAVAVAHAPPSLREPLARGLVRWHAGGSEVIVLGDGGRSQPPSRVVLEALRRSQVRTIDLLVIADPSVARATIDLVGEAHPIGSTHGPADGSATLVLRSLVVRIVAVPGRLVVDAVRTGPEAVARARGRFGARGAPALDGRVAGAVPHRRPRPPPLRHPPPSAGDGHPQPDP